MWPLSQINQTHREASSFFRPTFSNADSSISRSNEISLIVGAPFYQFTIRHQRQQSFQPISRNVGVLPKNRADVEKLWFTRLGFATELFQENAILFLEVLDDSLLVSAHPAGDRDEEELKLSRHSVENLSKVIVAQSSIWPRPNFLAAQVHANDIILSQPAGKITRWTCRKTSLRRLQTQLLVAQSEKAGRWGEVDGHNLLRVRHDRRVGHR
jgi:hypothetical protein